MGNEESAVYRQLKKCRVDALYGKKKHFNAADRKSKYQAWITIPVVLINLMLGSLLFGMLSMTFSNSVNWVAGVFALGAAILSGLQLHFNYGKQTEEHRNVASRYLDLVKQCDLVAAAYQDNALTSEELYKKVERLELLKSEINKDADCSPTNDADYRKAQEGIKSGEEGYTPEELNLD